MFSKELLFPCKYRFVDIASNLILYSVTRNLFEGTEEIAIGPEAYRSYRQPGEKVY